jgi:hypothetical protein
VVQDVVRAHFGDMKVCYTRALRGNPTLAGEVLTKFFISPDGHVASAEILSAAPPATVRDPDGGTRTITPTAATTLPDPPTLDCVRSVFLGLAFPKPEGGPVTVVYPLIFKPDVSPDGGA